MDLAVLVRRRLRILSRGMNEQERTTDEGIGYFLNTETHHPTRQYINHKTNVTTLFHGLQVPRDLNPTETM